MSCYHALSIESVHKGLSYGRCSSLQRPGEAQGESGPLRRPGLAQSDGQIKRSLPHSYLRPLQLPAPAHSAPSCTPAQPGPLPANAGPSQVSGYNNKSRHYCGFPLRGGAPSPGGATSNLLHTAGVWPQW